MKSSIALTQWPHFVNRSDAETLEQPDLVLGFHPDPHGNGSTANAGQRDGEGDDKPERQHDYDICVRARKERTLELATLRPVRCPRSQVVVDPRASPPR